jgi:curli biogenesis system outer membrane secretion channel CsgG
MIGPSVGLSASDPSISPSLAQQSAATKSGGSLPTIKRKVAIARFTNETAYGRSFLVDKDQNPIGKQALDILSKKLLDTGKFLILERADLAKINEELSITNSGQLKNQADYLVLGSVTEFGRKTEGDVGIFSRTKKQTAYAKVTIRLVDVSTGQIIYAEDGAGEAFSQVGTVMGVGARADYDSTLNDKALDVAITNLSSRIIENLLERPWRSYVLSFSDGSYVIAGGVKQGLNSGDVFDVIASGKRVKNPQTGMEITLPGKQVGQLRITDFAGDTPSNEVSLAKLISGELPQSEDPSAYANYYIQEPKKK